MKYCFCRTQPRPSHPPLKLKNQRPYLPYDSYQLLWPNCSSYLFDKTELNPEYGTFKQQKTKKNQTKVVIKTGIVKCADVNSNTFKNIETLINKNINVRSELDWYCNFF